MTAGTTPPGDLAATSPLERARAASWLLGNPDAITTRELMRALQLESVAQIRRTLLEVLEVRQRASLAPVRPAEHAVGTEGGDRDHPVFGAGDIAAFRSDGMLGRSDRGKR